MSSHSRLTASTGRTSFTPSFQVYLHSWPVETSLYQSSSLHHSLMGVVMTGLEDLRSERLGSHHLPLGVGCCFFSPEVQNIFLDLQLVKLSPQYFYFCGFLKYCISGGSAVLFPKEFFCKHKVRVVFLCSCQVEDWQIENLLNSGVDIIIVKLRFGPTGGL